MSIKEDHELMKDSLYESKDIINQIFQDMHAPESWQIKHMTFDELVASLYKISALYNDRLPVNVTPDDLLDGVTAFDNNLSRITGTIPSVDSAVYMPETEDKIIIESGKYVAGNQILSGDPYLTPENIKKGVSIFGVEGELEEGEGTSMPELQPTTADSNDIIKDNFAYDNNLNKVIGNIPDQRNKTIDGKSKKTEDDNLYISPKKEGVVNQNSEVEIPFYDIANLLDIDPSKIESGYSILGVEGTKPIQNEDTNGDGLPDINIPVGEKEAEWVDKDTVREENKNDSVYINKDTNNDKKEEINIDTNNDGKPDLNVDTDKDGRADVNIDINDDGKPELNIDTNNDYKADINIDMDRDGIADLNIDTDDDGIADLNIDTDGDGVADLNIDTNGDGIADLNIDTDGDGIPDLNIDYNGDGDADFNVDLDNDGVADFNLINDGDLNLDTDGDGYPDLNIDIDGDGIADLNIDTDGDGIADINIDTNRDGIADLNIDTDGDDIADDKIDSDKDYIQDLEPDDDEIEEQEKWNREDLNKDSDNDGEADLNLDTNNDDRPEYNIDTNNDGVADINVLDENGNIHNLDTDGDGIADVSDEEANKYSTTSSQYIFIPIIPDPTNTPFRAAWNDQLDEKADPDRLLFSTNDHHVSITDLFMKCFGLLMTKTGSTITVQYSGPQANIEDAKNLAYSYSFDLNNENIKDMFADGLRYGIAVDGVVESHWQLTDFSEDNVSDNEDNSYNNGKEFGEHVSVVCGDATRDPVIHEEDDPIGIDEYHYKFEDWFFFSKLRCPEELVFGPDGSINLDKLRTFVTKCKLAGYNEFTVLTADFGCVVLSNIAKTARTFSVDDVEECINYLKGVVDVLDSKVVNNLSRGNKQHILKIKNKIAHGPRKRAYDASIWGTESSKLSTGYVEWNDMGDRISQKLGPAELNYYVSETVDIEEDWKFGVIVKSVKDNKGFYRGAPGLILTKRYILDNDTSNKDKRNGLNIDTDNDGIADLNIDNNNDGKPDVNIDTNNDGIADLNIDTNNDGREDINIDLNNDGKPDLNIDTNGDGEADINEDRDKDGIADTNLDKNKDGIADDKIDKNKDGILDEKQKGKNKDPFEDQDYANTVEGKDENMNINNEKIEENNINDLKDDIIQNEINDQSVVNDPENTQNTDDNYMFDDNHDGETNDKDHQTIMNVNGQFLPNPNMQWIYTEMSVPASYPTVQTYDQEKYPVPVTQSSAVPVNKPGNLTSIKRIVSQDDYQFGEAYYLELEDDEELVAITSQEDQNVVEEAIRQETNNGATNLGYWTSGTDYGLNTDHADGYDWQWIRRKRGTPIKDIPITYTNWNTGEPNNKENREGQIMIYRDKDDDGNDAFGKWNDEYSLTKLGYITEEINGGSRETVQEYEEQITGQEENITSQEVKATMLPFVRYATAQEERSKMYHYGINDYLNLTDLSENLTTEMPRLKQMATQAGAGELAIETTCSEYMQEWPSAITKSSIAYVTVDGKKYEKKDNDLFLQDNYIDRACLFYKRLGKVFENNGQNNSYRYKDNDDTKLESPTVTMEGESFLQVYVKDLNLTPDQCYIIWRAAYYDFQDYLPKWQWPLYTSEYVTVQDSNNNDVEKEVVDHFYLGYYPEARRQQCLQTIENSFQEIAGLVKQYTGVDYNAQNNTGSVYEKGSEYTYDQKKKIAKVIHDWLVINNVYNPSAMDQSLFAAMSKGQMTPVCTSYSMAFKFCCNRYGIMCHLVTGQCNPGGKETDSYGGLHMWNRITYLPNTFTELQYLQSDGKILDDQVSCETVIKNVINQYDNEHADNYNSADDTIFFKDSSYEGNQVETNYIQSHSQFDKTQWTDVDVTWDDPCTDNSSIGDTSNITWDFFNVDSNRMKRQDSGRRLYAKYLMTDTGVECYANLIGQDNHADQIVSAKNERYMGSNIYAW